MLNRPDHIKRAAAQVPAVRHRPVRAAANITGSSFCTLALRNEYQPRLTAICNPRRGRPAKAPVGGPGEVGKLASWRGEPIATWSGPRRPVGQSGGQIDQPTGVASPHRVPCRRPRRDGPRRSRRQVAAGGSVAVGPSSLGNDQRLVDQSGQQHLDIVSGQALVGAHGRGAASRVNRPANTDSRVSKRRSSSNSRSKLQSTAACIVC